MFIRFGIVAALIVGVLSYNWNPNLFDVQSLCFFAIMAGVLIYTIRATLRRQREAWESFQIILSEDAIARRAADSQDIHLLRGAVIAITKTRNGTIIVRGSSLNESVIIPYQLDGLAELHAILESWHPIAEHQVRGRAFINAALSIAFLLFFYGAFFVVNPWIGVSSALGFAGLLFWFIWTVQRNPHYDTRIRRLVWVAVFPAGGALLTAILRVFPHVLEYLIKR